MLGNIVLLKQIALENKHTFISTGMSTLYEITEAVRIFEDHKCRFELMHCNSKYPINNSEANLAMIRELRNWFGCDVGYSGHETGRIVSYAAALLGATSIERHITLDKSMYGSDQAASIEINELCKLVRDIRAIPEIIGDGVKNISDAEIAVRKKLRYYE
jgi:N-acetylneuraminate synthase